MCANKIQMKASHKLGGFVCAVSLHAVGNHYEAQNYDFCAQAWDEELEECEFAAATAYIADYNTDAHKKCASMPCWTCKMGFQGGELRIIDQDGGYNTRHHLDCVWPALGTMPRRRAKQIKLELEKCPLNPLDRQLVCARLDKMASNHNQQMVDML